MSLQKIFIIVIIVIVAGVGIMYLWSAPGVYAPEAPSKAVIAPPIVPSEEQELGAISVDDLGKEMQDIDAELAK